MTVPAGQAGTRELPLPRHPAERASVRLRAVTRAAHDQAEAALGLPGSLHGRADLERLVRFWIVVWSDVDAALDSAWARTTPGDLTPAGRLGHLAELAELAASGRRRLRADLADLTDLTDGADIPAGLDEGGRGTVTPPDAGALGVLLAQPGGAWGVSYVLRGSLLGGAAIGDGLSGRLGLPGGCGTSYLRLATGSHVQPWPQFRRDLDTWAASAAPQDVAAMEQAALQAFSHILGRASQLWPATARAPHPAGNEHRGRAHHGDQRGMA